MTAMKSEIIPSAIKKPAPIPTAASEPLANPKIAIPAPTKAMPSISSKYV
jgi:hypothetical protein